MLEKIREAVLAGEMGAAAELTQAALDDGLKPGLILDDALIPALDVVGEEYASGIRYIPEMLISANAMKSAMRVLQPLLVEAGVEPRGRVVLGTVEGDLHDIGKNIVGMMLEGAGFDVIDLGVEVSADTFATAVRDHNPDVVAISALLTTTMTYMPIVLEALDSAGLRANTKVIVGGAPITQDFADRIGADGYAPDAPGAVALVSNLVG